jgi:hypothetical protein
VSPGLLNGSVPEQASCAHCSDAWLTALTLPDRHCPSHARLELPTGRGAAQLHPQRYSQSGDIEGWSHLIKAACCLLPHWPRRPFNEEPKA